LYRLAWATGHFTIYLTVQARELEKQPEIVPPLLTGNDLLALGTEAGTGCRQLIG